MPRCVNCGQEAEWEGYIDGEGIGLFKCSGCKPPPWTSGRPERLGVYYRPIPRLPIEEDNLGDWEKDAAKEPTGDEDYEP